MLPPGSTRLAASGPYGWPLGASLARAHCVHTVPTRCIRFWPALFLLAGGGAAQCIDALASCPPRLRPPLAGHTHTCARVYARTRTHRLNQCPACLADTGRHLPPRSAPPCSALCWRLTRPTPVCPQHAPSPPILPWGASRAGPGLSAPAAFCAAWASVWPQMLNVCTVYVARPCRCAGCAGCACCEACRRDALHTSPTLQPHNRTLPRRNGWGSRPFSHYTRGCPRHEPVLRVDAWRKKRFGCG